MDDSQSGFPQRPPAKVCRCIDALMRTFFRVREQENTSMHSSSQS